MQKCNFHVRHITFKCCLNYLLARPLWEKPATRRHGRIARETILLSARVHPNASNCRSALIATRIENRNFALCDELNSNLPDHVWVAPNEVPYTMSRPERSNRLRAVPSKEVMILRSCFDFISFRSQIDWMDSPSRWHHLARKQLIRNDAVT